MKAVLLVLDGLGVGEMPDVAQDRPQDRDANTLGRIVQQVPELRLPNLARLGLGNILPLPAIPAVGPRALASYGRCRLAHEGADSYLGHQEIVGTIPERPAKTLLAAVADDLQEQLAARGHRVVRPAAEPGILLVDDVIVIGDNLEADAGQNINLTVALAEVEFEQALAVGQVVRDRLQVARVIVFGGPGLTVPAILRHVHRRSNGQVGVDSPAIGVYDENLRVRHMGYGVDPSLQAPQILRAANFPVTLLGKMADVITCPGAVKDPVVATPQVMAAIGEALRAMPAGLIAATVQETDLAGHQGDARRMAAVLQQVDRSLDWLLPLMDGDDLLVVCADHGNDPMVSVGLHTREETPLLVYRPRQAARPLGVRATLADIGATLTDYFAVPPCRDGYSALAFTALEIASSLKLPHFHAVVVS